MTRHHSHRDDHIMASGAPVKAAYNSTMLFVTIMITLMTVLPGGNGLVAPSAPPSFGRALSLQNVRTVPLHALGDSFTGFTDESEEKTSIAPNQNSPLEWVSLGMSAIYLSHFASLYTQLPGLFGQAGLLPIADRVSRLNDLWALHLMQSPELGIEFFTVLGIFIAAAQIVFRQLRHGLSGVVTFSLQWILWHDLVIAGGRFMAYQMDLLVLDAAPLTILAASGLSPAAATYGYRWLLSRLYIGAGAVKLLSCDASWRNLSAVHWHFQSQPLPNPVGAAAYLHLPEGLCKAITLAVLVVEMAAPFLFLVPSPNIRRVAFVLNIILMVGIALFGDFGSLQALLIVIGLALLDDLSPVTSTFDERDGTNKEQTRESSMNTMNTVTATKVESDFSSAITVVSLCLAAWATLWTLHDVGTTCLDTWAVEPLVYGLLVIGAAGACIPLLQSTTDGFVAGFFSLFIFATSAPTMANGLGVFLPFGSALDFFNLSASPYGLFATITGVNGRPVAVIEAAESIDGPWHYVPLLYQVNDPATSLPLCFPHFPRLDWTLWFLPFGEGGLWIARFFNGIINKDPAITNLVDEGAFQQAFPNEPPAIVRVVPRKYKLNRSSGGENVWLVSEDSRFLQSPVLATFSKGDLARLEERRKDPSPWPVTPGLRPVANAGRPEYFVWGCLGASEVTRRWISEDRQDQEDSFIDEE